MVLISISLFNIQKGYCATVDELVSEAQSLIAQGWSSGKVKDHFENKYAGYLTRDEVNDIVNYADDPSSHAKPVYLATKTAAIPITVQFGLTSGFLYTQTGIPGLILSAMESHSSRIKGMGGTGVALYDNSSTVYHNSASVVQNQKQSMGLTIDGASYGNADVSTYKIAGLYSHNLNFMSLGGSFVYINESQANSDYISQLFSLQLNAGKEFFKGLTAGAKIKLNNYGIQSTGFNQSDLGASADIGVLYNHQNYISGGLSFQTYNDFQLNDFTQKIPSKLIMGGSIRPIGNLIALVDIAYTRWSTLNEGFDIYSDTTDLHIGAEYCIYFRNKAAVLKSPYKTITSTGEILSFRTGIRSESTPLATRESRNHFALGVGYKFNFPLHLDLGLDFASDYNSFALEGQYRI
jgi:hypothetical protein